MEHPFAEFFARISRGLANMTNRNEQTTAPGTGGCIVVSKAETESIEWILVNVSMVFPGLPLVSHSVNHLLLLAPKPPSSSFLVVSPFPVVIRQSLPNYISTMLVEKRAPQTHSPTP